MLTYANTDKKQVKGDDRTDDLCVLIRRRKTIPLIWRKGAKGKGTQSGFRREVFEVTTVNKHLELRAMCQ